jgi:hypothetical protein
MATPSTLSIRRHFASLRDPRIRRHRRHRLLDIIIIAITGLISTVTIDKTETGLKISYSGTEKRTIDKFLSQFSNEDFSKAKPSEMLNAITVSAMTPFRRPDDARQAARPGSHLDTGAAGQSESRLTSNPPTALKPWASLDLSPAWPPAQVHRCSRPLPPANKP